MQRDCTAQVCGLSMPGSASHAQGQKRNQNTPSPTPGCCFSWALEAQFWPCLQGCHPAPPVHHQGRTLCNLQHNYREAGEDVSSALFRTHLCFSLCHSLPISSFREVQASESSQMNEPDWQQGPELVQPWDESLQGPARGIQYVYSSFKHTAICMSSCNFHTRCSNPKIPPKH